MLLIVLCVRSDCCDRLVYLQHDDKDSASQKGAQSDDSALQSSIHFHAILAGQALCAVSVVCSRVPR